MADGISRRGFLSLAALGGVATVTGGALGVGAGASVAVAQDTGEGDPFGAQVDRGLEYFRRRADQQLPLAENLVEALRFGDLEWTMGAYVNARPPYEEIETLAASFEQTDSDIDARPYSFDAGEKSEDFKGFHRIEALIYRDVDLAAALPYAEGLVESVKTLRQDLGVRENFDSKSQFEGMVALATEVASKKISSEEETYSGQSLLIFCQNWTGIYSQFEPFIDELERREPNVAAEVTDSYNAAQGLLEPYFESGNWTAAPYDTVGMSRRAEIVKASYRLRESLLRSSEALGLV
jgi:iron uptake system component EfeO